MKGDHPRLMRLLASIKNDSEVKGWLGNIKNANSKQDGGRRASVVPGMEHISLEAPGPDEFTSSVYGSRFAAQDLPNHEMPEGEMPREIAYRMIKEYVARRNGATDANNMTASSPSMATRCLTSPPSLPPTWKMKPRSS